MKEFIEGGLAGKEICGALHLHTSYSDGGVRYEELINAARKLGLDYIVVTDHMTIDGRRDGYEKNWGALTVIVGYEQHDRASLNHYLILGTDAVLNHLDKAEEYVRAVKEAGGIGFIAHPSEKRHYFGTMPSYPWKEWQISDYDGIEIWNQMSDWMEQLRSWRNFTRLFYPRRFIGNVDSDLLKRWDYINGIRFVSCIGGVDAHTKRVQILFFHRTIFPIKVELQGIRTHLYLKSAGDTNSSVSKNDVLSALRNGNGFISNYRRGDARGTRMFLTYSDGTVAMPGINKLTGSPSLPASMGISLPQKAQIKLIRNGKIMQCADGKHAEFAIKETGVYRLEILIREKAWIYSNPFPIGPYPM
jgi:hypothetical protein